MAIGFRDRMRLYDFIPIYTERYLKIKDPKSWKKERGRLRRIKRHFGNVPIDRITAQDIEVFLAGLSQQGFKPGTVNRYHARLSSMLRRAMVWGHRDDNPLERIECLKENKLGDRYLEPEEFQALLDVCHPRLRPLVVIAAFTGMRQGEILVIDWQDINWKGRYLVVRAANTKTSESRTVPLNDDVMKVLKEIGPQESGQVFRYKCFPKNRWKEAIQALGWDTTDNPRLKGWRFHDLRHTCASWMVMADVPLSKIGKILGHKNLTTTQRYAHLADRSLFEAVDKIGRAVNGA